MGVHGTPLQYFSAAAGPPVLLLIAFQGENESGRVRALQREWVSHQEKRYFYLKPNNALILQRGEEFELEIAVHLTLVQTLSLTRASVGVRHE